MRFVWIKGEETSDMMFVFHHCLCDGGSAMAVLDEFLKLLDNPIMILALKIRFWNSGCCSQRNPQKPGNNLKQK
jgi:hypothetical protein